MKPIFFTTVGLFVSGFILVFIGFLNAAITVTGWRDESQTEPFWLPPIGELGPAGLLVGAGGVLVFLGVIGAFFAMHAYAVISTRGRPWRD